MFNNLKLELIRTLNNFIIEASAAIVRGTASLDFPVLPMWTLIFRASNGFRLKLNMLKVCLLAIFLKKEISVGGFF